MAFTYPHKPGAESRSVAQRLYIFNGVFGHFYDYKTLKNAEKGAKLANGQFSLAQLLKKTILNHLLKHLFTLLNGVHALLLGPCNTVREHPSIHVSYPNAHTICSKC